MTTRHNMLRAVGLWLESLEPIRDEKPEDHRARKAKAMAHMEVTAEKMQNENEKLRKRIAFLEKALDDASDNLSITTMTLGHVNAFTNGWKHREKVGHEIVVLHGYSELSVAFDPADTLELFQYLKDKDSATL